MVMKVCFYKLAFILLSILGYVILSSSYIPVNTSIRLMDTTIGDSVTRLDILKSKKWVKILENKMEDGIFLFSEAGFTHVIFWEGKPKWTMKAAFYLSETADKVFDSKKLGSPNGKYLVIQTKYYPDTYDDTEVYKIVELTRDVLKIDLVRLHNEVIAGGTPFMTFDGRMKDKKEEGNNVK